MNWSRWRSPCTTAAGAPPGGPEPAVGRRDGRHGRPAAGQRLAELARLLAPLGQAVLRAHDVRHRNAAAVQRGDGAGHDLGRSPPSRRAPRARPGPLPEHRASTAPAGPDRPPAAGRCAGPDRLADRSHSRSCRSPISVGSAFTALAYRVTGSRPEPATRQRSVALVSGWYRTTSSSSSSAVDPLPGEGLHPRRRETGDDAGGIDQVGERGQRRIVGERPDDEVVLVEMDRSTGPTRGDELGPRLGRWLDPGSRGRTAARRTAPSPFVGTEYVAQPWHRDDDGRWLWRMRASRRRHGPTTGANPKRSAWAVITSVIRSSSAMSGTNTLLLRSGRGRAMVPSRSVSEHARYRRRLGRLGADRARGHGGAAWPASGAGSNRARAARRTFGRFEPGRSPWATLLYRFGRTHVRVDASTNATATMRSRPMPSPTPPVRCGSPGSRTTACWPASAPCSARTRTRTSSATGPAGAACCGSASGT